MSPDPPAHSSFPITPWGVIGSAEARSPRKRLESLGQIYPLYYPPILRTLTLRGFDREEARDFAQGFFLHLIETQALAAADPAKGRFRTFLLSLLDHYLADQHRHHTRQKRGGGVAHLSLDEKVIAEIDYRTGRQSSAERSTSHDRLWAKRLLGRALTRLENAYRQSDREELFVVLQPYLYSVESPSVYQRLTRRLRRGFATLRSDMRRLRARFLEILREELKQEAGSLSVSEEKVCLREILRSRE